MPPPIQRIELQFSLNASDVARYLEVAGRHRATWIDYAIFVGALAMAVPVALAARAAAAIEIDDPATIELAGRFSLFAFVAGFVLFGVALWIARRRAIAGIMSTTPNVSETKTVLLDENAVVLAGKLVESRWTWPAITRVQVEEGLVLLWAGSQNPVVIPDRAFASPQARDAAVAFAGARIAEAQAAR